MKAIAYYRVSTAKQGVSGLGLEAQQSSVEQFTNGKYKIVNSYIEVESGKKNNRPKLLAALAECKALKAVLIIAKLDRLGRNVAFIASLMESKVDFIAVDNPHASKLLLHIMAAFAEHEREMISKRTKEALMAAKMRGKALGNPNFGTPLYLSIPDLKEQVKQLNINGLSIRKIAKQFSCNPTTIARLLN